MARIRWSWIIFAAIGSAALVWVQIPNAECGIFCRAVPVPTILFGLAIIWISLIPSWLYAHNPVAPPIPFFPTIGLFYAVFFGLPIFTIQWAWLDASSIYLYSRAAMGEINSNVIGLAACGIAGMVAAFYAMCRITPKVPAFRFPRLVETAHLSPLYFLLLVGHQIERLFPGWIALPSVNRFLEPAGYLALGGLYLMWRRGRLSPIEIVLATGLFLLEVYIRARQLYLTDILLLLIFVVFILWRERQYRLVAGAAACCLFVVSLYGATIVVRYTQPEGFARMALATKAYVTQFFVGSPSLDTRSELTPGGQTHHFRGRFGSLVMRTGHIWVFHIVAELSPDEVPYWGGKTYQPLLTSILPRALFPDKPEERFGQEFGRRYGLLEPDQMGTSINIPWLTELLANFGPVGVLLGMPLVGFLLALFDRIFNARDQGDVAFVFGVTLIFPLVYPESNLSVMIGSLPLQFVSIYVVLVAGALALDSARGA